MEDRKYYARRVIGSNPPRFVMIWFDGVILIKEASKCRRSSFAPLLAKPDEVQRK
jgi:hypothetical protein